MFDLIEAILTLKPKHCTTDKKPSFDQKNRAFFCY
jgi:hypothetical protein